MEESLREDTKYIFTSSSSLQRNPDDSSSSPSPSLCEIECHLQQTALVECMNSIRQEEEVSNHVVVHNTCLSSTVAAWTECCSRANMKDSD